MIVNNDYFETNSENSQKKSSASYKMQYIEPMKMYKYHKNTKNIYFNIAPERQPLLGIVFS